MAATEARETAELCILPAELRNLIAGRKRWWGQIDRIRRLTVDIDARWTNQDSWIARNMMSRLRIYFW